MVPPKSQARGVIWTAEKMQVGTGDPAREYYLHVSTVYPAVAAGSVQGAHAELLHGLTSTALACSDTWLVRLLHPSNVDLPTTQLGLVSMQPPACAHTVPGAQVLSRRHWCRSAGADLR